MIQRSRSVERHAGEGTAWLRRWLVALNLGLLLAAAALGLWITRRAWFLAVLVPVAFAPFSYARLRLARMLDCQARSSTHVGWFARAFALVGVACDLVMVAHLLSGRSPDSIPFLHATALSWVGPIWFSAHII